LRGRICAPPENRPARAIRAQSGFDGLLQSHRTCSTVLTAGPFAKLLILRGKAVIEDQQSSGRSRRFRFGGDNGLADRRCLAGIGRDSSAIFARAFGPALQPVTTENPVFHFTPDRDVTFSLGWNWEMVNYRRLNNAGWVNDQNYRKDDETPLLAIIGVSYVEAMMVPYAKMLYGRLANTLQGRLRVYSFGASGAPLS
jgi:hypothetical protein